jgi:hypothetical protein
MDQPQSFNEKQRETFAQLLEEARQREEANSESESDDDQVEAEAVSKIAKETGASKLYAKVRKLQKDLEDAVDALEDLGFCCGDDVIELRYGAPKALKKSLEDAKRAARKEREAALRKYDLAILDVWTAKSVQEAKKIVEKLL